MFKTLRVLYFKYLFLARCFLNINTATKTLTLKQSKPLSIMLELNEKLYYIWVAAKVSSGTLLVVE